MTDRDSPAEESALDDDQQLATDYVFMIAEKYAASGQPIRPLGLALLGMSVEVIGKAYGRDEMLRIVRELANEVEQIPENVALDGMALTRH